MLTYPVFIAQRPPGLPLPMPPVALYQEYVFREVLYEDYVDLFRGAFPIPGAANERIPDPAMPGSPNEYIDVTRLGIPHITHLHIGPYPWTLAELTGHNRRIRYVMIGESARARKANTFFYDPHQLQATPYFSSPCKIFNIPNNTIPKRAALIQLADMGVLLIDIFPYGVELANHRHLLFNMYWYTNLINRLNVLAGLLSPLLTFALVAPITTNEWVINSSLPTGGLPVHGVLYPLDILTINAGVDYFNAWSTAKTSLPKAVTPAHLHGFHNVLAPYSKNRVTIYSTGAQINTSLQIVSSFRKQTVARGTRGPNPIYLAFAFDL